MKFRLSLVFFSMFLSTVGCFHQALHPVPLKDVSKDHLSLFPFYAWKNDNPENPASFQLFMFGENGSLKKATLPKEKPKASLGEVGKQLFNPEKSKTGIGLDESPEFNSPNSQWLIKTYSIKTFADDLDNTYLVIRDAQSKNSEKVKVPALSDGEMWPLFWHPQKPLFYFMVRVGEGDIHSLELWEYDVVKKTFENIGDTNGHAFVSPDGHWIVWETGPMLDDCHLKSQIYCVLLRAYDTQGKVNYQITKNPSVSSFHRWKAH